MKTAFIYMVNGTELYSEEAFGQEWKEAKTIAREAHCGIYRAVVRGEEIRYEFYAKGGCFLNERFYTDEKIEIF